MAQLTDFVAGQRWVSNTEPELGLGIILEHENRRIVISFPASGEQRTYASDNAPLSRIRYREGEVIGDNDDVRMTITDILDNNGYLIYLGETTAGEQHSIPELELNSFVQFSSPKDRLFSGQIDKLSKYRLRHRVLTADARLNSNPARGLMGGRVQLLPHQFYIANEVANRFAPRVLLADEVGLGKTIEAGLIIHKKIITGNASRILIVLPDSLVHQWLVEMRRRFNLMFTLLDEMRCIAIESGGHDPEDELLDEPSTEEINPFESAQLVICSISTLSNSKERQAQAVAAGWDLMVVDEAHHLEWAPDAASVEYKLVEQLAAVSEGLLLLTATPEQLGLEAHFARLRLLDPDRYYNFEKFVAEQNDFAPLKSLVEQLLSDPQNADKALLTQYLGDEQASEVSNQLHDEALVSGIVDQLLDRNGTGRVLFRNSRANISGFPKRVLHKHALEAPEQYVQQLAAADITEQLKPECLLGDDWVRLDSRAIWLRDWLKANAKQKALVICADANTALALESMLRLNAGIRTSIFHEGMSLIERDRAGAYFAEDDGGAQVLVCSEIGSEGRNFQFAQHIVLFDLPLNPDLLEQRIGRLDRIGQQGDVNIHVPYYANSAQQKLLHWYENGLAAFTKPFPAGQQLVTNFGERLCASLVDNDEAGFQQLVNETQAFTTEVLEKLQAGRDRLLELSSCKPAIANKLITAVAEVDAEYELPILMDDIFDQFGVNSERHSEQATVITPSDELQNQFPGLPEDGLTVTYDRNIALSRDDMEFLSWEHPLVTGALEMIRHGEHGNTSFCTLKVNGLPAGSILVEAMFQLQCIAPKNLPVQRYLTAKPLRLLIDAKGRDLGKFISIDLLNKAAKKVPKHTAQQAVRQTRAEIESIISLCENQAKQAQQSNVEAALAAMNTEQLGELNRLEALAAVNPNIRQSEVEYQKALQEALANYLAQSEMNMTAVRVIVVTE